MPSLAQSLKQSLFFVIARTCFALYRWFPVFGSLRASVAIIHREHKVLVIQRSDGRGLSLPGGIAARGETEDVTVRREVLEETGLTVTGAELRLKYHSTTDVPCDISVYRAEASGELKDSWEGSPCWMTIEELEPRLLESQRPVLELLKRLAG